MVDWDVRYRDGNYDGTGKPHALLARFGSLIPKGPVIDIASGTGRDALFLAGEGHPVWGLERSAEALKIASEQNTSRGHGAAFVKADASALPFKRRSAAGVTVFYFLLRDIMGEIVDLLAKDGILIYETFLKRQNMIDRLRNPDYLLDDGELISCFRALDLIFYEEKIISSNGKRRAIAQFVGRKP